MAMTTLPALAFALYICILGAGCVTQPPAATQAVNSSTGVAPSIVPAGPPRAEFYRTSDQRAILDAARAIITDDRNAGFVTIDEYGRPRVRTVYTSEPDENMVIWVATRPSTRKVEQIRQNSAVSLYYSDDAALSYVSVMGTATLHDDAAATIQAKTFFEEARLRKFWPEYPKDFLLIRIQPQWIEVTGRGIEAHPDTWRPQAVEPGQ
jgi:general stress protein 26